jgi:hypothetical protein
MARKRLVVQGDLGKTQSAPRVGLQNVGFELDSKSTAMLGRDLAQERSFQPVIREHGAC